MMPLKSSLLVLSLSLGCGTVTDPTTTTTLIVTTTNTGLASGIQVFANAEDGTLLGDTTTDSNGAAVFEGEDVYSLTAVQLDDMDAPERLHTFYGVTPGETYNTTIRIPESLGDYTFTLPTASQNATSYNTLTNCSGSDALTPVSPRVSTMNTNCLPVGSAVHVIARTFDSGDALIATSFVTDSPRDQTTVDLPAWDTATDTLTIEASNPPMGSFFAQGLIVRSGFAFVADPKTPTVNPPGTLTIPKTFPEQVQIEYWHTPLNGIRRVIVRSDFAGPQTVTIDGGDFLALPGVTLLSSGFSWTELPVDGFQAFITSANSLKWDFALPSGLSSAVATYPSLPADLESEIGSEIWDNVQLLGLDYSEIQADSFLNTIGLVSENVMPGNGMLKISSASASL